MFFEQTRRRTAAGLHAAELASRTQAAGAVVDQLADGRAHRDLVVAGLADVAGDRDDLEAGRPLRSGLREPFGSVAHDVREVRQRLDVVDDRRLAIEAFDRRKRRLQARLAPFSLRRGEPPRLFPPEFPRPAAGGGGTRAVTGAGTLLLRASR